MHKILYLLGLVALIVSPNYAADTEDTATPTMAASWNGQYYNNPEFIKLTEMQATPPVQDGLVSAIFAGETDDPIQVTFLNAPSDILRVNQNSIEAYQGVPPATPFSCEEKDDILYLGGTLIPSAQSLHHAIAFSPNGNFVVITHSNGFCFLPGFSIVGPENSVFNVASNRSEIPSLCLKVIGAEVGVVQPEGAPATINQHLATLTGSFTPLLNASLEVFCAALVLSMKSTHASTPGAPAATSASKA